MYDAHELFCEMKEIVNKKAGEDSVKVNGANAIHLFKQQENEKPQVVFCIKQLAFAKPAIKSYLPILGGAEWNRTLHFPANQHYFIASIIERGTNPHHSLVVA